MARSRLSLLAALVLTLLVNVHSQSYGELALQKVYPAFQNAVIELGNFSSISMPEDPAVKDLRKDIGLARQLLDVFVFAYPNDTGVGEDLFVDVRGQLDTGYEAIGNFKDLYDSQNLPEGKLPTYKKKELNDKRNAALRWKDDFLGQFGPKDYDTYVRSPSPDQFFYRKQKHLSKFYWRAARITPEFQLTGIENLQRLTGKMTDAAVQDFGKVSQLTNLVEGTKEEDAFHDLRKWLRCIDLMCTLFPEILTGAPADVSNTVGQVKDLVSSYGDIHDRIVAYDRELAAGHTSAAKEIASEINGAWDLVKKQQAQDAVKAHLTALGNWILLQIPSADMMDDLGWINQG